MSWRARIPGNVSQGASSVSEPEPVEIGKQSAACQPGWRVAATRHLGGRSATPYGMFPIILFASSTEKPRSVSDRMVWLERLASQEDCYMDQHRTQANA